MHDFPTYQKIGEALDTIHQARMALYEQKGDRFLTREEQVLVAALGAGWDGLLAISETVVKKDLERDRLLVESLNAREA